MAEAAAEGKGSRARRRWPALVALLALAGVLGWLALPKDSSEPAPPEPGAYAYATRGFERVDVLGGARHDYPATTGITVRPSGCGYRLEWRPLRTRVTAYEICRDRLRSIEERHEFFGRRDDRRYACTPDSSLRKGWTCTYAQTTEVARGGEVGGELIDGVETAHVRFETEITGDTVGTGTRDFWLRREDGFPIRLAATNENTTSNPLVGSVEYRERYRLELDQPPPGTLPR